MSLWSQMLIYSLIFPGTCTSFGYLTTAPSSFEWALMPFWHVPPSHLSWLLILVQQNANKHDSEHKRREAHKAVQDYHLFVFTSLDHLPCARVILWHETQNKSSRHQTFAELCPHLSTAQHSAGIWHKHICVCICTHKTSRSKTKQGDKAAWATKYSKRHVLSSLLSKTQCKFTYLHLSAELGRSGRTSHLLWNLRLCIWKKEIHSERGLGVCEHPEQEKKKKRHNCASFLTAHEVEQWSWQIVHLGKLPICPTALFSAQFKCT